MPTLWPLLKEVVLEAEAGHAVLMSERSKPPEGVARATMPKAESPRVVMVPELLRVTEPVVPALVLLVLPP